MPSILVIEDDDAIQSLVEDALNEGGFETAVASTGEEAVTLLKGGLVTYRALVTDITLLGRFNGWEVARAAREVDPSFPVVYMSGVAADEWLVLLESQSTKRTLRLAWCSDGAIFLRPLRYRKRQ
ncbi:MULTISPECIES: response regulator [unclassified Bradyrhizobium]|uniref:response regulator n=1 Tax=unclassified Bradyrhizobium TaxID=2631580 RepID=UPI001FFFDC11|nr:MULTISPECIES: response regulator [unclassified Bradyrhizobium]